MIVGKTNESCREGYERSGRGIPREKACMMEAKEYEVNRKDGTDAIKESQNRELDNHVRAE
jgi:hypothetical protein